MLLAAVLWTTVGSVVVYRIFIIGFCSSVTSYSIMSSGGSVGSFEEASLHSELPAIKLSPEISNDPTEVLLDLSTTRVTLVLSPMAVKLSE